MTSSNIKLRLNKLRTGMTMIELLVAVSVLAILILIFGRVLSQSQKVVTGTQNLLSFNASATAAAKTLKSDISAITPSGFLYIEDNYVTVGGTTRWPRARMYIGAPNSPYSWVDPSVQGSGGIVGIGLCDQNNSSNATVADEQPRIMWRARWVMATVTSTPPIDVWNGAFDSFISGLANPKRQDLYTRLIAVVNASHNYPSDVLAPKNLNIPPDSMTDVQRQWKYFIPNITKLSIMWTKGDIDNNTHSLIWYGRDIEGNLHTTADFLAGTYTNPISSSREFNDAATITSGATGYNAIYTGATPDMRLFQYTSGGYYRAFWSQEITDAIYWPTAIKITYEITNGDTANPTTKTYEIICPTGI